MSFFQVCCCISDYASVSLRCFIDGCDEIIRDLECYLMQVLVSVVIQVEMCEGVR